MAPKLRGQMLIIPSPQSQRHLRCRRALLRFEHYRDILIQTNTNTTNTTTKRRPEANTSVEPLLNYQTGHRNHRPTTRQHYFRPPNRRPCIFLGPSAATLNLTSAQPWPSIRQPPHRLLRARTTDPFRANPSQVAVPIRRLAQSGHDAPRTDQSESARITSPVLG